MAKRKQIFGFDQPTGKVLSSVASAWTGRPQGGTSVGSFFRGGVTSGIWLMEADGVITAYDDPDCGTGDAKVCQKNSDDEFEVHQPDGSDVTTVIWSMRPYDIPDEAKFYAVRDMGGTLWVLDLMLPHSFVCKVTAQVSARSGTTPGTGTVQPLHGTSTLANLGSTVSVYSFVTSTIAVDAYGFAQQDADGELWITSLDCE